MLKINRQLYKPYIIIILLINAFQSYSQADKIKTVIKNNSKIDSLIKIFDFKQVEDILNNSLRLANEIDQDSIFAMVYENHAKYYYYTSNYKETAHYLIESAKLYEKIGDIRKSLRMYNNISAILNRIGSYQKALETRKKILSYKETDEDPIFKTSILSNLGSDYRKLGKKDSSFIFLRKALKISKSNNFNSITGAIYNKFQRLYLELGQYQKSIKYADSTHLFKDEIERPIYENSVIDAAKAYYKIKNYNSALDKSKEVEELIRQSKMTINLPSVYRLMSDIYQQQENFRLAHLYLDKQIKLQDSLLGKEKQKEILELEKKYETEKKENENLQLKQETAEKDLSIAQKNNVILISSLIFGIIIVLLILYQLKKFKTKNQALKESIEIREKIEKELEVVRDNIAKDFHDDLGNKLARIATLSDLMISTSDNRDKENIVKALKSIKMDSDVLYKGTRDFMFSLKANSDYIEELFTYLSDFGEEFFESFSIDFFVEKHIQENIKLPYYWTRQIIMIFKEAMTNVVKHSNATMATLTVKQDNNNLFLALSDNGSGFDIEEIERKNGLTNIESRAHKINANIEITSSKKGTIVCFNAKLSNLLSHAKTSI